jgi:hypothetical protein
VGNHTTESAMTDLDRSQIEQAIRDLRVLRNEAADRLQVSLSLRINDSILRLKALLPEHRSAA